jgi:hypothetical protein
MELCSLHPFDLETVHRYVLSVTGQDGLTAPSPHQETWWRWVIGEARRGYDRAVAGDGDGASALTYGLAQVLATQQPSFFCAGMSLTAWEARIDRGIGMLMRPPSRLFIDAGLDIAPARVLPIRLDLARGMMGGAFIPARLMPDLERLLDARIERVVRRLIDSDLDGVAVMGLMIEAARYARERGLGLYEAMDVITPSAPEALPPGAQVVIADRKRIEPSLRKRLEQAAKPPKKPGLLARVFGKPATSNGGASRTEERGL